MIIDAHAHVLPKDYPDGGGFPSMRPVSGETVRDMVFGSFAKRLGDTFFEPERRIEAMDAAGVHQEIVSPLPPLLNYTLDVETGRALYRHVNDFVAHLVSAGEGRIHGLGIVPLQDPAVAAQELSTIAEIGLRGVELGSQVNGVSLGDARFAEVFQEAERLGLSIFVHTLPRADEAGLPAHLRASVGVGIEATRGAASVAFGGLAQKCTLSNVLFSHAAAGFPAALARMDYFWEQEGTEQRTRERPSDVARRFYYDSMVFDPLSLRFAVDYLGVERMVLGTDFPAMRRPAQLADILDPLGLGEAHFHRIASDNARAFLGLDT